VIPDSATPVALLALVPPATIVVASLLSAGPAMAAIRTRPAPVLREE
jgi:hypothetical protein